MAATSPRWDGTGTSAFLLTPLDHQSTRELVLPLHVVAVCGVRPRPELRMPNQPNPEAIRAALHRTEWREVR